MQSCRAFPAAVAAAAVIGWAMWAAAQDYGQDYEQDAASVTSDGADAAIGEEPHERMDYREALELGINTCIARD